MRYQHLQHLFRQLERFLQRDDKVEILDLLWAIKSHPQYLKGLEELTGGDDLPEEMIGNLVEENRFGRSSHRDQIKY